MRKQSMMGSSKYEFNPKQFDLDIQSNMKRYSAKREMIKDELKKNILRDNARIDETWTMIIDVLREMKEGM